VLEIVARAGHGGGGVGAELAGVERESGEWRGRRSRRTGCEGKFLSGSTHEAHEAQHQCYLGPSFSAHKAQRKHLHRAGTKTPAHGTGNTVRILRAADHPRLLRRRPRPPERACHTPGRRAPRLAASKLTSTISGRPLPRLA
jgi:hypothetical protein